jgi:hypothetical protein
MQGGAIRKQKSRAEHAGEKVDEAGTKTRQSMKAGRQGRAWRQAGHIREAGRHGRASRQEKQ